MILSALDAASGSPTSDRWPVRTRPAAEAELDAFLGSSRPTSRSSPTP